MSASITPEELGLAWDKLDACCLHNPGYTLDEVAEVVWAVTRESSGRWVAGRLEFGSESQQYALLYLTDNRLGFLEASEDYTGHGCMCRSRAYLVADIATAWRLLPIAELPAIRDAIILAAGEEGLRDLWVPQIARELIVDPERRG